MKSDIHTAAENLDIAAPEAVPRASSRRDFKTGSDTQKIIVLQHHIQLAKAYFEPGPSRRIIGLLDTKEYPESFIEKVIAKRQINRSEILCWRTENGLSRLDK